jgi:hypothetical protein
MGALTMVVVDSNLLALIQAASPLNRAGHGLARLAPPLGLVRHVHHTANSPQHREAPRANMNVENRSAHA